MVTVTKERTPEIAEPRPDLLMIRLEQADLHSIMINSISNSSTNDPIHLTPPSTHQNPTTNDPIHLTPPSTHENPTTNDPIHLTPPSTHETAPSTVLPQDTVTLKSTGYVDQDDDGN